MRRTVRWLTLGLTLALILCRPVPALAQSAFSDVPTDNGSLYDSVQELASKGILNGYPDGTFGGKRAMTRWEFVAALWRVVMRVDGALSKMRANNTPAAPSVSRSTAGPFADVPTDSSRGDLLRDLGARGIIQGYPDQTFAGLRPVTQGELAAARQRTLLWVDRELASIRSAPGGIPAR